jgi:hypothetical protein
MATTTKKTAKKAAKKTARKTGKKAAPTLKQLVTRTQKIHGELTQLLALMRRMGGTNEVPIDTDLESSPVKIIQPL